MHMKRTPLAAAALAVGICWGLACTSPVAANASSAVARSSGRAVTAQAAYECQGEAAGAPSDSDTASVQVQLGVPSSVAPGDTVSLRGSLKIQLSEKLRQRAQAFGVDTIDAYSNTMSTYRTMAGQSVHYFADRWQTGPTPIRNPMEIEGALNFPSFTVPANSSGGIKLQMPQNGATANIVTNNPAKVAFSVYMRIYGPGGTFNAKYACYFPRTNPAVIATIPVSAARQSSDQRSAPVAESSPTTDAGAGSTATGAAPGVSTTVGGGSEAAPGPVRSNSRAGAVGATQVGASEAGEVPPATGTVPAAAAYLPRSGAENGVYVSSGVLFLGGFTVILAALGYALLTNFRIRSIRRSMEG